jgi:hypothetical protein
MFKPNVCGGGCGCCPKTCAQLGYNCGMQGDGCGGVLDCGTCPAGLTCGAWMPGVCGPTCDLPKTCAQQGIQCGMASDQCGGVLDCGKCPCGFQCSSGMCVGTGCTPKTCAALGLDCGQAGGGCGCIIDCGTCTPPQTGGGGGQAGVCG